MAQHKIRTYVCCERCVCEMGEHECVHYLCSRLSLSRSRSFSIYFCTTRCSQKPTTTCRRCSMYVHMRLACWPTNSPPFPFIERVAFSRFVCWLLCSSAVQSKSCVVAAVVSPLPLVLKFTNGVTSPPCLCIRQQIALFRCVPHWSHIQAQDAQTKQTVDVIFLYRTITPLWCAVLSVRTYIRVCVVCLCMCSIYN